MPSELATRATAPSDADTEVGFRLRIVRDTETAEPSEAGTETAVPSSSVTETVVASGTNLVFGLNSFSYQN